MEHGGGGGFAVSCLPTDGLINDVWKLQSGRELS